MRIPLLYRGEYSQWRERFMNYLEEQTDGEEMINSIQNEWKQYGTLMRKTNNLMDINIGALYNILKQNQGDVNDALGYKKKAVVVTSDPLALVAEKTKLSKRKEKVVVQSESEGSDDEDISDLKKITALLSKAFNQRRHFTKDCKKAKVKDYNYYKTKMLLAKKDGDEKVLLAEDQAWMESNLDESSSSAEETIAMVAYCTSESESKYEYETSEYYDHSTNYGLFVNNNDDQEIFHDAIESASENFNENHIVSQKECDESEVDHNDSEEKDHLVDKLIQKFNHQIAKWKQYGTLMRKTNNLMDINIGALYNILKQNQGDVNDALGYKKKALVVTSDPLALVAEKTKVSKRKEKVVVQSESEGSDDEDISDLKTITTLLSKAFNQKKYYAKPTNNNLRTSSASSLANKKPKYMKSEEKKKAKVKDYNYYKTKMLLAKKDGDEKVFLAEDQAWMESSSDSDQEINENMVFMAKMEKVLSDLDESSSSAEETIAMVAYCTSESESEYEYETSEYYDHSTNYGLFVNNNDDQEIFHDAIESASENFNENHIVSQKECDESKVDHNDSEEKDHLVDKLIQKFNHQIAKCQKHIEKANQQSKYLENQNKDLQGTYDVLINQVNTFEEKNNEFNEQMKVLNEKNADLLAQTEVLQD
nr:hypothetical protein [Tanacetum cinerariifolium]